MTCAGAGTPLLDVDRVTVSFGGIRALNDVSLQLTQGCCGIIGPNGAGKTTLLDTLSGIRHPDFGRIRLDGEDVSGRSSTWLAQHGLRRTFQRHQAFGWLTVEENLLVAVEWRGRSRRVVADLLGTPGTRRRRAQHADRVVETLEQCGLMPVRNERAATLPIGQLRLLEFARAIIDRPRLLLLDEPTSGLGPEDTRRLGAVIAEAVSDGSCAAILVEHDLDFVLGVCNRLIVLQLGAVLADGEPETVRHDAAVIDSYIGTR
jgi:branched-chain amino acid transport system ATP-binding protein